MLIGLFQVDGRQVTASVRWISLSVILNIGVDTEGRLLRFGSELVFALCEAYNTEVVIINQGEQPLSYEEELSQDVLEIITVFSARLYGSRSHKNRKLIQTLREAAKEI